MTADQDTAVRLLFCLVGGAIDQPWSLRGRCSITGRTARASAVNVGDSLEAMRFDLTAGLWIWTRANALANHEACCTLRFRCL